ncbi:DUF1465 family protein [Microvirga sp. SRT01]|uniref:DUF1465 family protein n=1 Tax=Sphingomonas longa TaxID=2778730 RepID=A0ABS2D2T6_9SPHN|nr:MULTISPECIES: DUF1465 family protein [Alphaproteobacteria]MBM6575240.1 DUF1465 family protein [Sphingomonas sp. BT552]MBR7708290.1 DUF1465 family protein [Microvirga sp. SRT01]
MTRTTPDSRLDRRFVDALYTDAMLLADEVRAYFDEAGREERESLDPFARVTFSCESLKVTTRLMHVIAWLMTQRAVEAGELTPRAAADPSRRLGDAPAHDADVAATLPPRAGRLIAASAALHRRAAAMDRTLAGDVPTAACGVHSLQRRLAASF